MNFNNMGEEPPPPYGGAGRVPGNFSLSRQPSVYSLTIDEFQNSMGGLRKDFGSMNMDEFLRNIWTAEEAQGLALTTPTAAAVEEGIGGGPSAAARNLQRQVSLTLPRTLSQKTVDEVWKELYKESGKGGNGSHLGEMTLEEFLVRAGVVREDAQSIAAAGELDGGNGVMYGGLMGFGQQCSSNGGAVASQVMGINGGSKVPNQSLNLGISGNGGRSLQQQQQLFPKQSAVAYASPIHLGNNGFVQGGGGGRPGGVRAAAVPTMNHLSSDGAGNGNDSSLSPVSYMLNGSLSRKRGHGTVEKVVERRQKRMIKNRESAARSRARKQAYTMELEAEVAKLKEENLELRKKQEEFMEMQNNQFMDTMIQEKEAKKRCLRRTQTGPW